MNQFKLQMELQSLKLRKQPRKVPQEFSPYIQSNIFLQSPQIYNYIQLGADYFNYPKVPQKLMIRTHLAEEFTDKLSCDSPLSSTQMQMKSLIELKKMVLSNSKNRIKINNFLMLVELVFSFQTMSYVLQQRYQSLTSSNHYL
ncbi:unnamed protein product [Paramecium octaurelia]|uniref:Uncharacterized protein n=1 Tax=Paramecium octaurelia TaxID=43137 RepID=A0A8S1UV17_PAROT|nr:unnamed protein product [Paramecium octaurelia]